MDIATKILNIEVGLLFVVLCVILLVHVYQNLARREAEKKEQRLRDFIVEAWKERKTLTMEELSLKKISFEELLDVIESFDAKLHDQHWQQIKDALVVEYLIPEAEKNIASKKWQERLLALRCMALAPPSLIKENLILPLLGDTLFSVRIAAASCLVSTGRLPLIERTLAAMQQEGRFGRYAYHAIFIEGDASVYAYLEKLAESSKDQEQIVLCLELLANRVLHNYYPLAAKYIEAADPQLRYAATKLLKTVPGKESAELLCRRLDDSEDCIRALAIEAIGELKALNCLFKMAEKLTDPSWNVRFQAAWALKNLGAHGRFILYQQHPRKQPLAYEIAQHVLARPALH